MEELDPSTVYVRGLWYRVKDYGGSGSRVSTISDVFIQVLNTSTKHVPST